MARRQAEAGITSTELAVLFPVVVALVLLPFQMALWWHAKAVADGAAREAVDVAQVATATEADGEAAAWRFLGSAGNVTDADVVVTRTPDGVTAEVTGRSPRLLPGLDWAVAARASGSLEVFVREPER